MKYYKNLQHAIESESKCIFCKSKLKYYIKNFNGIKNSKSSECRYFNIKNVNNFFKVPINYFDEYNYLKSFFYINVHENFSKVEILNNFSNNKLFDFLILKMKFVQSNFYLEMSCSKRSCYKKHKYGLLVKLDSDKNDNTNIFNISSIYLETKSFEVNGYWVINNYIRNNIEIISLNNSSAPVIRSNLINFDHLDSEKIIRKINTIVNFS